jgi:hypothetical protein
MKPHDLGFALGFSFVLVGALGAAACTAQAGAPPPNGPPPPELQIGSEDDAQGEADPPPPPSAPAPTQVPAAPGAPPPPPVQAGQMAPPPQPAAAPPGPAPSAPPAGAAPVAQSSAPPVAEPADATGQWIYTSQYGWLWMPYSRDYTYVSADGGEAYEYAYYPNSGWRWVYSPWVLGWGPSPYWGRVGPRRYVWYTHPWFRVGVVHRGPVYHRRWHRR